MPPPAADLRTSCRQRPGGGVGADGGEAASHTDDGPAPTGRPDVGSGAGGGPAPEPPGDRVSRRHRRLQRALGRYLGEEERIDQPPDEALLVGQVVESAVDGARGVVVARHRQPTARLLVAAGRPFQSSPHYLVMAGAGQLPVSGALEWGALGFNGRLSYVPEHELTAWRGAAAGGRPPVRLPAGAEGRNDFFIGFDERSMRFLPSALLLDRRTRGADSPDSPEGQGEEADEAAAPNGSAGAASGPRGEGAAAAPSEEPHERHREFSALLEELDALSGRLESARAVAASQLKEQLEEKRLQLLGRRRALRKLRGWLEALQSLGGATPGASAAEGDIDPEGDFDPEFAEDAPDEEVAF